MKFMLNSITIRYTEETETGENLRERTYDAASTTLPSLIRHAMMTVSWWLQYVVSKEAQP